MHADTVIHTYDVYDAVVAAAACEQLRHAGMSPRTAQEGIAELYLCHHAANFVSCSSCGAVIAKALPFPG